jgi:molecular chaperone DnaK
VSVLGAAGNPRLGGDDLDERITEYALTQIRERYHVELGQDDSIRRRIRREAEIRKRELATAATTVLGLPLLTATVNATVPLTRHTFESLIEPDLRATLACLTAALTAAEADHGVVRSDVDQVLLVGGSARMPVIRSMLAGYFALDPADVRADVDAGDPPIPARRPAWSRLRPRRPPISARTPSPPTSCSLPGPNPPNGSRPCWPPTPASWPPFTPPHPTPSWPGSASPSPRPTRRPPPRHPMAIARSRTASRAGSAPTG